MRWGLPASRHADRRRDGGHAGLRLARERALSRRRPPRRARPGLCEERRGRAEQAQEGGRLLRARRHHQGGSPDPNPKPCQGGPCARPPAAARLMRAESAERGLAPRQVGAQPWAPGRKYFKDDPGAAELRASRSCMPRWAGQAAAGAERAGRRRAEKMFGIESRSLKACHELLEARAPQHAAWVAARPCGPGAPARLPGRDGRAAARAGGLQGRGAPGGRPVAVAARRLPHWRQVRRRQQGACSDCID
jgi:hypothetical protein